MPLPAPQLDDRRFQDLVDELKRRIPVYAPEWTNHNLSDPGVALIELFAWLGEIVLYRVNQVPDRLYVHFLNLVGIEPFPPSVALADLTFWLSGELESPAVVPSGTQVMAASTVATGEPIVFTTVRDLEIAPPQLHAAKTVTAAGDRVVDVWADLRFDPAGVRCFASDELTPGDTFCLGFAQSLAGVVLRLQLSAQAEGIGVDPKRPPLVWEVWNGEGWITAKTHDDSTGGLNRDGEVVLLIPVEHELFTIGNTPAYWLRVKLTEPASGQPTYRASPRIRQVAAAALGGTVTAEHSDPFGPETIGRSDGQPGQSFAVDRAPVLPRRAEEHIQVVDGTTTTDWTEVEDFTRSGRRDRHYVWDSATGVVRFGPRVRYADGSVRQHGAVPPDGAQIIVTAYRHGGGARGNVAARTLTVPRTNVPYVSGVINLAPASGGVDAESVAEAKERGPLTLRTGQRAVTAGDYERLTIEASTEVRRARCLPTTRGNGSVRVLVVPHVRSEPREHHLDDFAISAPLMKRISDQLDGHRLVGTSVEIATPYYQGVSVVTLLHSGNGRPVELVRQRVHETLTRYINPLTGGPDGEGWPFDGDLNAGTVTQLIESVEGVERVDEVLLFEYDLRTGQRLGSAKDVIRLDKHSLFLSAAHQVVVR